MGLLEWTKRPTFFYPVVAALCVVALALGYFAVTWYRDRDDRVEDALQVRAPAVLDASPSPTPDASKPIVVHATGDVNLDPSDLGLLREGYEAPWTGVRDLFRSDDVSIINLECAAGDGGAKVPDKEFNFRCPRGFAAMRTSGVDVANQANNHSLDFGPEAMLNGRANLTDAGIAPVGAGRNVVEANSAAILDVRGTKIAVLGFGGVIPFRDWLATPTRAGMSDGDDIPSMVSAVKTADAIADYVFVAIHWGAERETKPQAGDVERAHAMIDAGADGIFGHHAHRLQPLETYKKRPIFYGLGNFVWPRPGPTAVAEVVIEPEGKIVGCLLPGRTVGGRPVLDDPAKRCV
jgi:poly-gamma-glutamate synthesis protein (capsule biosynthesis protein)